MKTLQLVAILLIAVAVLFAGCGKSDEMKKLEAGLNTEVMQKHDDMMKAMSGLDAVARPDHYRNSKTRFTGESVPETACRSRCDGPHRREGEARSGKGCDDDMDEIVQALRP